MTHPIGFQFKPTFPSNLDHFEVRGFDEKKKHVLTIVYPKNGSPFDDSIEEEYYEAAFAIGDYVPLNLD